MKKKLSQILMVLFCVCLLACNQKQANDTIEKDKSNQTDIDVQYQLEGHELQAVGETREKGHMVLVATYNNPWLQERIAEYNRSQTEYQIELRVKDEKVDFGDFERRLLTEILANEGPDMVLNAFSLETVQDLAKKGALADLRSIIDEEDKYWDDLYGENTEPLYAVALDVQPCTLIVNKSIADQMRSCTPEELMRVVRESGARQFGAGFFTDGMSGTDIVNLLAFTGQADKRIIDFEAKKCFFEDDYFLSILEFAKTYQASQNGKPKADRFYDGEIIVAEEYLTSPFAISWAYSLMGGEAEYIGYPTPNGSYITYGFNRLSASASSKNIEGIKEFIGFLLSEDSQSQLTKMLMETWTVNNFPVRKDCVESLFEKLQEWDNFDNRLGEREGVKYREDGLTIEQIDSLRYVFNHLAKEDVRLEEIRDIAYDELYSYFQGNKSAEETAAVLNNRIKLYLLEN